MSKKLNKLVDLDIDEISVVDRGANQHSLISFSKSLLDGGIDLLEEPMPDDDLVFDDDGQEVFVEELEHGDVVFDVEGNEYVFVEEDEYEEVGKASFGPRVEAARRYVDATGRRRASQVRAAAANAYGNVGARTRAAYGNVGARTRAAAANAYGNVGAAAANAYGNVGARTVNAYVKGGDRIRAIQLPSRYSPLQTGTVGGNGTATSFTRGTENFRRNRIMDASLVGGSLLAVGGGAGYGAYRTKTKKSLGDSVIEELSKAVTDSDRDEVIAKAMDEVEIYKEQASEALAWAEHEHEVRVTEAFISKAADYNLPVAAEILGPILKSIAEVLDEEDLDILDALLSSVSDALYEEIGYVGESSNGSVMDQVDSMALEYVGKSDFSHAQMTTAMFEANPAAYDAYISEMGR